MKLQKFLITSSRGEKATKEVAEVLADGWMITMVVPRATSTGSTMTAHGAFAIVFEKEE
jgi:hypothetical protein